MVHRTKLKYVPEQDTDFIFCTVGEEEGFIGSAAVLFLFTGLILRLIVVAERQHTRFARVYGYSVLSIFLFHLFINIGMVLGLTPVIGIPLPFFQLWGGLLCGDLRSCFFVFLRIDAGRGNVRVYWFSSLRNWIPISLIPVNGLSVMIWTMRKVRALPSVRIGIDAL